MNRALFMIIRDYSWIITLSSRGVAQTRLLEYFIPKLRFLLLDFYIKFHLKWTTTTVCVWNKKLHVSSIIQGASKMNSPYFECYWWPLELCFIKIMRFCRFKKFSLDFFKFYSYSRKLIQIFEIPVVGWLSPISGNLLRFFDFSKFPFSGLWLCQQFQYAFKISWKLIHS